MKSATMAILVVIIIVALIIGLRASGCIGGKPPADVTGMPVTLIDVSSLELVETDLKTFESYKIDPATGYSIADQGRKLALPTTCANCSAKIPPVPLAEGITPEDEQVARDSYKCPKCGNPANMPVPR